MPPWGARAERIAVLPVARWNTQDLVRAVLRRLCRVQARHAERTPRPHPAERLDVLRQENVRPVRATAGSASVRARVASSATPSASRADSAGSSSSRGSALISGRPPLTPPILGEARAAAFAFLPECCSRCGVPPASTRGSGRGVPASRPRIPRRRSDLRGAGCLRLRGATGMPSVAPEARRSAGKVEHLLVLPCR